MTKSVERKISDLTRRARYKDGTVRAKASSAVRNGSSLHKVIKTKEQATVFMKLLKSS